MDWTTNDMCMAFCIYNCTHSHTHAHPALSLVSGISQGCRSLAVGVISISEACMLFITK